MEAGELSLYAMNRETLEEIGIIVEKKHLALVHTLYRAKRDDLRWFPLSKIPENTVPYVRDVLEHIKKDVPYSEVGTE